jgi:hypothetical protein
MVSILLSLSLARLPSAKISFLILLHSRTDANRFGQAYLEKFGWDASKGLGASGEGRTSAIKATQKLDMLGIGMQHQKDPNGIAWRQNRDFENLLRRLNEGGTSAVAGPFHNAREEESLKGWGEGGEQSSTSETGDLQRMNEEDEVVVAKKEKKKGRKEKKKRKTAEALEEEDPLDKKRRKKRKKLKDGDDDDHAVASDDESEPPLAPPCPPESSAQQKEEPGSVPPMTAVTAPVPIRAPYVASHIPRTFFFSDRRADTYISQPQPAHTPRPHHRGQTHGGVKFDCARRDPRHPVLFHFFPFLPLPLHRHHSFLHPHPCWRARAITNLDDIVAVCWRLLQGEAQCKDAQRAAARYWRQCIYSYMGRGR